MRKMLARLRSFFTDLSLRKSIAAALVVGLAVPVGISTWVTLTQRRAALLDQLRQDHARIVDVLALGMQSPLWEIRPGAGQPLIDALMLDDRVASIVVSSPLVPQFLAAEDPNHRRGEAIKKQGPVMHADEEIGLVVVEMDTGSLEAQIAEQWVDTLLVGLLQFATGMVVIFVLLRFKVLGPLERLVGQSEALASGALDLPLDWRQGDEVGVLGRSLEKMRQSLCNLVSDLEQRNRDLQHQEAELARQAAILRAILDNMTDGITLFDDNLRLVAWNHRFIEIMKIPPDIVKPGLHVDDIIAFDVARGRFDAESRDTTLRSIKESFSPGGPYSIQYQMADGQWLHVRRRPTPDGRFVSTYTDVTEPLEARRKADETRLLLEAVMDAVPAMLHVKDPQFRYEMVNRHFLEYWGFEREDFIGRTSSDVFAADVSNPVYERDRQVLDSGQPLPFEEIVYGGEETRRVTLWSTKVPLLDGDGRVAHIVTVDIDISERKRAEEERQRWAQLLHDAVESIPSGFAVYDADKCLVICNTALASLYGVPAETLVGVSYSEVFSRFLAMVQRFDGHSAEEFDLLNPDHRFWGATNEPVEVQLKDGRWLLISSHPTAEGGLVFLRTDITHLKRMEQAVRDSEQRFRSIAEAHPVPVIIGALKEERLLYVSPGMARLYGAPVSTILESPPQLLFDDPGDRRKLATMLIEQGSVTSFECIMRKADGSTYPVAITARRVDYLGTDAAVGGIIDLTEIREAEEEIARQKDALYQSEKLNALGSLLAGVAHELNNPLSVVVGRTIMLENEAGDAGIRAKIEKVRLAAERCARIVKTFLAIARQHPPERRQVQLNTAIESAVELVAYGLRTADVEVLLDLDPDLPEISADSDQLTQVFTNLIVNAQQALLEIFGQRRLEIQSRYDTVRQLITIEFTDNGPGVPKELRARIFEPFYTSRPVGVGTGIGLSFSYGVVASHGGGIVLENPDMGGARFIVTLPVSVEETAEAAPLVDPPITVRPHSVLIVDDEPEIAELLCDILTDDGHQIDIAASGNQALEKLKKHDYDVILSDLKMPDLDGPNLYRRLKVDHPRMTKRVVFITGDTLGVGTSEFLQDSGRPLIEKPFIPKDVINIVREVIAAS